MSSIRHCKGCVFILLHADLVLRSVPMFYKMKTEEEDRDFLKAKDKNTLQTELVENCFKILPHCRGKYKHAK